MKIRIYLRSKYINFFKKKKSKLALDRYFIIPVCFFLGKTVLNTYPLLSVRPGTCQNSSGVCPGSPAILWALFKIDPVKEVVMTPCYCSLRGATLGRHLFFKHCLFGISWHHVKIMSVPSNIFCASIMFSSLLSVWISD